MMTVAYQQEFTKVAVALVTNTTLPHGPNPPDLRHNTVHIFPSSLLLSFSSSYL
jgi:hypothetical protein